MPVLGSLNLYSCFPWKTSMAQGSMLYSNHEHGLTSQKMSISGTQVEVSLEDLISR